MRARTIANSIIASVAAGSIAIVPLVAAERSGPDAAFTTIADIPIGPPTERFDYQSLDPTTDRLFIAGMSDGKLIVLNVRNQKVEAKLPGFAKVTGVLAVPAAHRVYASVPGAGLGADLSVALGMAGLSSGSGKVAILDSVSLKEIARPSVGVFPDGIAYDPDDLRIFVSDELGSAVAVIDGLTDKVIARKAAAQRKFDMVAAWSVDRLSWSLHDLTGFLNDLRALHVDLYLHQQGLDTSTPTGKAMYQMVGVFAELERAIIRERVMAGLARAKAEGKTLGRKRTDKATERKIERALARGDRGIRKIAREIGVGVGTVQRIKAAMPA